MVQKWRFLALKLAPGIPHSTPFELNLGTSIVPSLSEQIRSFRCNQKWGANNCGVCLRKTVFLSHLYIKTIILPRQARDKHRENVFSGTDSMHELREPGDSCETRLTFVVECCFPYVCPEPALVQ
jgi:hypothetical protein